jgi:hypothetical protein
VMSNVTIGRVLVSQAENQRHNCTVHLCVVEARTPRRRKQACWRQAQVQKSAEHYTEAAQDEIELLAAIAGHAHRSAEGAAACVRMLDHFEHRGPHGRHVCMVFEVRRPGWLLCFLLLLAQ